MRPTNFPWIPGLHDETEVYTQRRSTSEAPANYKFTLLTLYNWIKAKLGFSTVEIEFPTPVLIWECEHNIGRRTQREYYDLDGNILHGAEIYNDDNKTTINWAVARAGRAVFS